MAEISKFCQKITRHFFFRYQNLIQIHDTFTQILYIVYINSNHKMTLLADWIVFHWFRNMYIKILIFLGQHFEILAIVQTRNIKDNPMVFLGQKTHEKSSSLTSLGAVFKVIHHKYYKHLLWMLEPILTFKKYT